MRLLAMTMAVLLAAGCDEGGVRYQGPPDNTFVTDTANPTTTGSSAGYCDARDTLSECTGYTGSDWDEVTAASNCVGTYVAVGSCPTVDALGYCRFSVGLPTETVVYYFSPGYQADDLGTLQTNCELVAGVWTEIGNTGGG